MTEARREQIQRVGVFVLLFLCLADIASYFLFGHLSDVLMWLIFGVIAVGVLSRGLKGTINVLTSIGISMSVLSLFWLAYGGPNWIMSAAIGAVSLTLALLLQLIVIQRRCRANQ